ncbi:MAG: hypothetical protein KKI02_03695, partial [Planctomycetes bacterium]|nr:hypothetical protein [Planctomycetota bacterium]
MCNKRTKLAVGITVLLVAATGVVADDFTLDWWTVDGGGEMFTTGGGDFELSGTIGQPDAGPVMTGGGFDLTGGFWAGAVEEEFCFGDIEPFGG